MFLICLYAKVFIIDSKIKLLNKKIYYLNYKKTTNHLYS